MVGKNLGGPASLRSDSVESQPVLIAAEPREAPWESVLPVGPTVRHAPGIAHVAGGGGCTDLPQRQLAIGTESRRDDLDAQQREPSDFGKLFEVPLDGQVYAQPLFEAGVNITVGSQPGIHDVVFVATQHDSVYAIDAHTGQILWQDRFIDPAHGVTTISPSDIGSNDVATEIGITSTPVIDPSTGTLYVLARTKEVSSGNPHFVQTLHALDVSSGAEKLGGPTVVADTSIVKGAYVYNSGPFVFGTGDGTMGGRVYYNALRQNQRPALTLADGRIFIASASQGDVGPFHGWVLSYDAGTLQLDGAFCDTPNGSDGGIWQGGAGAAVDAQGYLYYVTGNGTFDTRMDRQGFPIKGDYGDSIIKLAIDPTTGPANPSKNGWGLKVVDYFTPSNQAALQAGDVDLGSGGILLLPDNTSGSGPVHLLVTAGKEGRIYLINRDSMGKFNTRRDRVVQELPGSAGTGTRYACLLRQHLLLCGTGRLCEGLQSGRQADCPRGRSAQSPNRFGYPGSTPSVSSNGAANGVVWILDLGTSQLRAYDAANLGQELYNSSQALNGRDRLGGLTKFSVPTVTHGQVFVGTSNSLAVFGLIPPAPAHLTPPSSARAVIVTDRSVTLAWQDNSSDESGFQVFRSANGGSFSLIATLPANTSNYVDSGLKAGTSYTYYIAAFDSTGATSSGTVDVTTLAPLRSLPRSWKSADTGAPTIPGYAGTVTRNVISVTGSAANNANSTAADAFQYAFQKYQGNVQIVAHVGSFQAPVFGAKVGVLIRPVARPGGGLGVHVPLHGERIGVSNPCRIGMEYHDRAGATGECSLLGQARQVRQYLHELRLGQWPVLDEDRGRLDRHAPHRVCRPGGHLRGSLVGQHRDVRSRSGPGRVKDFMFVYWYLMRIRGRESVLPLGPGHQELRHGAAGHGLQGVGQAQHAITVVRRLTPYPRRPRRREGSGRLVLQHAGGPPSTVRHRIAVDRLVNATPAW